MIPSVQPDLFTGYEVLGHKAKVESAELKKERKLQEILPSIKKQFGKNSILKVMNLQEGATAKKRNRQIGGHKA